MTSLNVHKNMPTLDEWVYVVQKQVEGIKKSTGEQKMTKVRHLYVYLLDTHPVWRDQKHFVETMRSKTHELWHEPTARRIMEFVIEKYNWKTCGYTTESGKVCNKPINFGDTGCCFHEAERRSDSIWNKTS